MTRGWTAKGLGAVGLIGLLGAGSYAARVSAADNRIKCDFPKLERAQADAQKREPRLVGMISGAMTPVALDAVYVIDDSIRRKIMPQDLFVRRTPAGSVEVMARIANCTDKPLEIQVRTSFMDEEKFPTEDPSAWQTVFLAPRSIGTYKEVSIGGPKVAYYLIEVSGSN